MGNFQMLLGLMLVLLALLPLDSILFTLLKTVLVMGAVSTALKIVSFNFLTDWATNANQTLGATAITGVLVFVGINFVIQQADIPFIPDNAEMVIRYIFYVLGGAAMAGGVQWTNLFTSFVGLWNGQGDGILGILKALLDIVTLGLTTGN